MLSEVPRGSIPEPVVELCDRLRRAGHGAWVVGGSLRDLLLERDGGGDWDVATSARPEEVQRVFPRVVPTGIQHGTVTVLWRGQAYEVTTLRGEGAYSDSRRPDEVVFLDDIEQDLARRDFTANALAFDPSTGRLIDPFGGMADLSARVLRTVGDARDRFAEDGLRVLRAARFVATLEFALEQASHDAIGESLDAFARVSPERVRDEWLKTLGAREPSRGFEVMRETGVLSITCPDLVEQAGCTQNRYHAYDVWGHSMRCMDACDGDAVHRLAGLLHDLGKPRTRELSDKTGDYTFYNHERVGADMADVWLRRFRFSNDERSRVVHLVRHHLVCYTDEWTDAAVRRFVKRVGPGQVDELLRLAWSDALAKGRDVEEELLGLERLRQRVAQVVQAGSALGVGDLAVGGREIMDHLQLPPGPAVGRVLSALLERVLDDPALNERTTLLRLSERLREDAK